MVEQVIKRNNTKEDFKFSKILNAINSAALDVGKKYDNDYLIKLTEEVEEKVFQEFHDDIPTVEEIQDIVEEILIANNLPKIAKKYILYRDKRNRTRQKRKNSNNLLSEEFLREYKHKSNPFPTELGEFIYYRTYSRWNPEEERREYWWETVKRAVEYNCSLASTSRKEAEKLYDNVYNFRQFLAGRTLWTGGTKASKKYPMSNYNCFTRDTEFVTDKGIKSFEDFEDGESVTILDGYSSFTEAKVKNFGEKNIYELVVNKGTSEKSYKVTEDHIWFVRKSPNEKKYKEVQTKNLKIGDVLREKKAFREKNTPNICNIGVQHGVVFGDGTYDKKKNHCKVSLIDEKQELLEHFNTGATCTEGDRDSTLVYGLPYDWKEMPSVEANPEYILGFIVGYIATDGSVSSSVKIASSSKENLEQLKDLAITVGINTFDIRAGRRTNNNYGDSELYELTFDKADITSSMILRSKHQGVFNEYNLDRAWKVKKVKNLDTTQETWCVTDSRTGSFTLDTGIHTHNCASMAIDSFKKYKELFYLLMIGAGVGVRVLPKDVDQLPKVRTNIDVRHEYYNSVNKGNRQELTSYEINNKEIRIIVGDSKEAWTQALEVFLKVISEHYFKYIEKIYFNYDNVRPKGERLKTFGGWLNPSHLSIAI